MDDLYLRSKEQEEIIGKIGGIANVYYRDFQESCHTIVLSLLENVVHGKSSIVVVANEDEKLRLQSLIKEVGLDPLSLSVGLNQTIRSSDIENIKNKFAAESFANGSEEMKEFKYNLVHQDILSYFQNFQNPTSLEKSWYEVLYEYISMKPNDKVFMLHAELNTTEYQFDKPELESLRESLTEALYLYQRDFELNDASLTAYGIKPGTQVLDRLQDVTHDLFSFKEIAEDMRDRFYTCLHDIEHDLWNTATASIKKLEEGLELAEFRTHKLNAILKEKTSRLTVIKSLIISDSPNDAKKASLLGDLMSMIKILQEKQILKTEMTGLKYEDVLPTIEILKTCVADWKFKLRNTISANLKSSNKLNFNNHRLMDLELDLQALILRINQSEIFESSFELNTISFKKQIEFVTQLVYEIEIIMMRIEQNIQYYQWVSFLSEQDIKIQKLIQVLKKFDPREWASIFEMWYLYEVLNQAYPFGKEMNSNMYATSCELLIAWNNERIDNIVSDKKKEIKDRIKELKTDDISFYKALTKNDHLENQIYWKHLLENCTSFFSSLFPILIVGEDDLKSLKPNCYTELFYLNSEHKHDDILQDFKTIHSYYPEEVHHNSTDGDTLTNFRLNFDRPLNDVATTDRLSYSKKLANNLTSFDQKPLVFQLKTVTIISFASTFTNTKVLEEFYSHGIKNILIDDSIYETIIACLLEEKKIVLITEDYLLSHAEFHNYDYQFQTLNQAIEAGFVQVNLDTKGLFDTAGSDLESMLDLIKFNNGIVVDYKNQFQLEFK
jgi:hypothetical protein